MKVRRNDPCPCGSGKKYKHCCYEKDSVKHEGVILEAEGGDVPAEDEEPDQNTGSSNAHRKDRSRFKGQDGSRSATFRPKASRGAQRGG